MPHTSTTDRQPEKSPLKLMLLALATAFIAILQAVLRKPFTR